MKTLFGTLENSEQLRIPDDKGPVIYIEHGCHAEKFAAFENVCWMIATIMNHAI